MKPTHNGLESNMSFPYKVPRHQKYLQRSFLFPGPNFVDRDSGTFAVKEKKVLDKQPQTQTRLGSPNW